MSSSDSTPNPFDRDGELLAAYRLGDNDAVAELYRLHYQRAVSQALLLVSNRDVAEDVASEAFVRVLEAIRKGKGPTVSMGHYLGTSVRSVAALRGRSKETAIDSEMLGVLITDTAERDVPPDAAEASSAFSQLPERYQRVIWLKDVEGMTTGRAAAELKQPPISVTMLYRRARHKLRVNYLDECVAATESTVCAEIMPLLSSYVLRSLGKKQTVVVEAHLSGCASCPVVARNLENVSDRFLATLPPAAIGLFMGKTLLAPAETSAAAALTFGIPLSVPMFMLSAAASVVLVGTGGVLISNLVLNGVNSSAAAVGSLPSGSGQCSVTYSQHPAVEPTKGDDAGDGEERLGAQQGYRFVVHNTGDGACSASFDWNGIRLFDTGQVQNESVVDAPRAGEYQITLRVDGEAKTFIFQAE